MNRSLGFWDGLLGEKKTVDLPQPDGTTKRVIVTKKWWDEMVKRGLIKDVTANIVKVNIIVEPAPAADGASLDELESALLADVSVQVENWQVGVHIPPDLHAKFVDPVSRELYAVRRHAKDGRAEITIVRRTLWEQARRALADS